MKKTLSLILALVMLIAVTSAFAEGKEIDGLADRGITIHEAGLNEVDDLVSPTTGRNLMEMLMRQQWSLCISPAFLQAVEVFGNKTPPTITSASYMRPDNCTA